MRLPLVLATGNADKAREICEVLTEISGVALAAVALDVAGGTIGYLVERPERVAACMAALALPARPPDVTETGDTLEENARIKARGVGAALGVAAVADDTGLEVDALGGAPGVRSARFAGAAASDRDNVTKLLGELRGVEAPGRTARFATIVCVREPDGHERVVQGTVEGHIATEPRGSGGFGYDPVFVPVEGDGRTFAEMAPAEKHAVSHRGRAVRALARLLLDEPSGADDGPPASP